ncbi:Uu.00g145240.m01.CDS01 [Anthostomella pinea]|uniref:Uu.00g145240.m01.CDS01 n=1 Tax=Anthostomella pinea TaxID=933095 RepID=A0AAI8YLQ4_9PEZI|nr:Uu.00g145240.m01.CDS01 [Anthostomella pinea]
MSRNNIQGKINRVIPDLAEIVDFSYGDMDFANGNQSSHGTPAGFKSGKNPVDYEAAIDLNVITRRQMVEDINAYRYDVNFCRDNLDSLPDLTPQETRTLQIRILDCGHNIRHCQHRIEHIDAQVRASGGFVQAASTPLSAVPMAMRPVKHYRSVSTPSNDRRPSVSGSGTGAAPPSSNKRPSISGSGAAATPSSNKRPRFQKHDSDENEAEEGDSRVTDNGGTIVAAPASNPSSTVQRLGYWMCHLCTAQKYLDAGSSRVPSEASKWPLKDISKMMNHFLDMHTEHTPQERCRELGDALAQNKGPFEYWLTRTRAQEVENPSAVLDEYIETLQNGSLPEPLRGLNRAAGVFPNTVSGAYGASKYA